MHRANVPVALFIAQPRFLLHATHEVKVEPVNLNLPGVANINIMELSSFTQGCKRKMGDYAYDKR